MPKSSIKVRFAKPQDAHEIASIHTASWQKIYRGHIPDRILDNISIEKREHKWLELINNKIKILVIEKDNVIVGFASLCAARDKELNPITYGEISALYLHPNVWRQGLGSQLANEAFSILKDLGFNEVIVWVLRENIQAKNFYESLGFTATGATKLEHYDDIMLNEVQYHKKLLSNE